MKNIKTLFIAFVAFSAILSSCVKDHSLPNSDTTYEIDKSYTLNNIKYGNHEKQKMNIYLPKNRNSATKVFVLVHGGGWNAGDKSDMNSTFDVLKDIYPDHAIINLNYRLGTVNSPGYTKQIDDIALAIEHIKDPKFNVSNQFCLFGASAGAHLSLLYAYAFDPNSEVKGVVNTVGPTDITDPEFYELGFQLSQYMFASLVGPETFEENPSLYEEVSPAYHVTSNCPPTISFYGDQDPLIPNTQMNLLHDKLDAAGVYNVKKMYQGAGHGNWNQVQAIEVFTKTIEFINLFFN